MSETKPKTLPVFLDKIHFILAGIAADLSRQASHYIKFILFFSLLAGSFYKPLRVLPGMGFMDRWNYYIMIAFFPLLPVFLLRRRLLAQDVLVFCSLVGLSLTYFFAGLNTNFSEQSGMLARFLFPIAIYFMFRYVSYREKQMLRTMHLFAWIGALFLITEFLVTNYLQLPIFAFYSHWVGQRGEAFAFKQLAIRIPGLGYFYAPFGIAGQSQSTGAVFASLIIFFYTLYRHNPAQRRRSTLLTMAVLFLALACTGSKTGIAILFWMLFIVQFGFNIFTVLFAPFVGIVAVIGIFVETEDLYLTFFPYLKAFGILYKSLSQIDPIYWYYTLFGQGESTEAHSLEFSSEIDLFDTFMEIGLINYVILFFIFFNYVKYVVILTKKSGLSSVYRAGLFMAMTLLLGTLHYNAVFVYPGNILVLAMMGFTAHHYDLLTSPSHGFSPLLSEERVRNQNYG